MLTVALTYIILALGTLIALCLMILHIGKLMAHCPEDGGRARVAAITTATGFAAIGAGGVALVGAGLLIFQDVPIVGLLFALGFAALCLGLGFTQAIATLQAVMQRPERAETPVA
jgi:hypothetical protein